MKKNFERRFTDRDEMFLADLRRMERLPDTAEAKRLAEYVMIGQKKTLIEHGDGSRHNENWESVAVEMFLNKLKQIMDEAVTETYKNRRPDLEIYYENARNGTEFEYIVNRRLGRFIMADENAVPYLQLTIQATELPKREIHIIKNRFAITGRRMEMESTECEESISFEEFSLFAYLFNKYADQQKLYNKPLLEIFSRYIKKVQKSWKNL